MKVPSFEELSGQVLEISRLQHALEEAKVKFDRATRLYAQAVTEGQPEAEIADHVTPALTDRPPPRFAKRRKRRQVRTPGKVAITHDVASLKSLIDTRRMSTNEVARLLGVNRKSLVFWITCAVSPTPVMAAKIRTFLGSERALEALEAKGSDEGPERNSRGRAVNGTTLDVKPQIRALVGMKFGMEEIARHLGVSGNTVRNWNAGKKALPFYGEKVQAFLEAAKTQNVAPKNQGGNSQAPKQPKIKMPRTELTKRVLAQRVSVVRELNVLLERGFTSGEIAGLVTEGRRSDHHLVGEWKKGRRADPEFAKRICDLVAANTKPSKNNLGGSTGVDHYCACGMKIRGPSYFRHRLKCQAALKADAGA